MAENRVVVMLDSKLDREIEKAADARSLTKKFLIDGLLRYWLFQETGVKLETDKVFTMKLRQVRHEKNHLRI